MPAWRGQEKNVLGDVLCQLSMKQIDICQLAGPALTTKVFYLILRCHGRTTLNTEVVLEPGTTVR